MLKKVVVVLSSLFFALSACAEVLEDFESVEIGETIVDAGWDRWYSAPLLYVVEDSFGSKVAECNSTPDGQYYKSFVNTGQFDDSTSGAEGYFSVYLTPGFAGTAVKYLAVSLQGPGDFGGSYPGFELAFEPFEEPYRDKARISLETASFGPVFYTTDPNEFIVGSVNGVGEDSNDLNPIVSHTYELRIQIKIGASIGGSTGTVWYRDVTAGDIEYTKSEIQDVTMGFNDNSRPSNWDKMWLRTSYIGHIDNFELGMGSEHICQSPAGDMNGDCQVNHVDLIALAETWLDCAKFDLNDCN